MYYFIVNPSSQCGMGYYIWKKMEKHLRAEKIEYEVYMTTHLGDAKSYVAQLSCMNREQKIISVVGGDGTMNEVIDGLDLRCPVILSYVPVGIASNLARQLKLSRNPMICLQKILSPERYCFLDYGVVTYGEEELKHRRFMVSAGIGVDAVIFDHVHDFKLKKILHFFHLEKWVYLLVGCKQLFKAEPVKGYLVLDGSRKIEFNHIYAISAYIHHQDQHHSKVIAPNDIAGGKLNICVVNSNGKGRLYPILWKVYGCKKGKLKGIRRFCCDEAIIHINEPMAVHADGESCLVQNVVQIRFMERKIKMII